MSIAIVPEPPQSERDIILAVLEAAEEEPRGGWAKLALLEAVEQDDLEP